MKFQLKLRKRNLSKDELLLDIVEVHNKLGNGPLTADLYAQYGNFGVNTMLRKFGSWNSALASAGIAINNRLNIPNEELFENLALVWQILGRQPYGRELDKGVAGSTFSLGTYEKRFGSWNNALVEFIDYIENGAVSQRENPSVSGSLTIILPAKRTKRKINWRLRAAVLIRDNCICQMCGASPSKDPAVELHVDHKIPYSKGGETVISNLRTLCSTCNIGRSNAFLE